MDEMKKQAKEIVDERIEKSKEILKEMPRPWPPPLQTPSPSSTQPSILMMTVIVTNVPGRTGKRNS